MLGAAVKAVHATRAFVLKSACFCAKSAFSLYLVFVLNLLWFEEPTNKVGGAERITFGRSPPIIFTSGLLNHQATHPDL